MLFDASFWRGLLQVVTNLVFVLPIAESWKRRKGFSLEIWFLCNTFAFSILYHLCDDAAACLLPLWLARPMDHFFAMLVVPVVLLSIARTRFPETYGFTVLTFVLFDAILVLSGTPELAVNAINFCFALGMLLFFFSVSSWVPFFNPKLLVVGGALGLVALVAYSLEDYVGSFAWILHSLAWHTFAGIALFLIVKSHRPQPPKIQARTTARTWNSIPFPTRVPEAYNDPETDGDYDIIDIMSLGPGVPRTNSNANL